MDNVLLVDDEENVLKGFRRSLRSRFHVDTASSAAEALEMIGTNGSYPVIVSDMRMPEMDGVELLARVKESHPDMVRVLLTGNSDQQTAVQAINRGDVFRFLNKPCPPDVLGATLATAVEHHRLLTVEKDLLANTLKGAVEMLVELLSLVRPEVLGQTMRLREQLRTLDVSELGGIEPWTLETAVLLSQLGYTTLSGRLVERAQTGQASGADERGQLQRAVDLSASLIHKIPRLDDVAAIIRYQEKHFDGGGSPQDDVRGSDIPPGARCLKVMLDFDRLLNQGYSSRQALTALERRAERYDPAVLQALTAAIQGSQRSNEKVVAIHALTDRMVLVDDVVTQSGVMLIPKGMRASDSVQAHLQRFLESGQIAESVKVHEDE
ncbi:MAG: response regulator [Gammaproteobacteria bacterium]|nr:response regulator [Gammaproteobacteria bacterium]